MGHAIVYNHRNHYHTVENITKMMRNTKCYSNVHLFHIRKNIKETKQTKKDIANYMNKK